MLQRWRLTTGDNRADMAFRALQPFSKQIKQDIGNHRVVLKPNNVSIDVPLTSTHVDTLEGVLEFLKSINKLDRMLLLQNQRPTGQLWKDSITTDIIGS